MTKKSKELITKAVIEQLDNSDWTFESAMSKWWMSMRSSTGMRLTDMGDLQFRYADIEFYKFDFYIPENVSWYSFIMELNDKLKCPYYIGVTKQEKAPGSPYIKIYDHRIAMMINLYGDINSYIKTVKVRK